MAEFIAEDRQRADDAYRAALVFAKAEFDALQSEYRRLQQRVLQLRFAVRTLSTLLDEPLEDRFDYTYKNSAAQKARRYAKPR